MQIYEIKCVLEESDTKQVCIYLFSLSPFCAITKNKLVINKVKRTEKITSCLQQCSKGLHKCFYLLSFKNMSSNKFKFVTVNLYNFDN